MTGKIRYASMGVLFGFLSVIAMAAYVPFAVTSGANKERIERVRVEATCTADPCTIAAQSGSWVTSINKTGTGQYTINIASGTFTAAPTCVISTPQVSNGMFGQVGSQTTSAVTLLTFVGTAVTNGAFNVLCMGPR